MLELRRDDLQLFLIHYSIFVLLYIGNIEFKMDSKNGLQIFNPKMPPNSTPHVLQHAFGPMKVISGLLPETWGYFCMKNFISTTRNCHSHIHESTHFILFAYFHRVIDFF
jgi:hypothetical protein